MKGWRVGERVLLITDAIGKWGKTRTMGGNSKKGEVTRKGGETRKMGGTERHCGKQQGDLLQTR